MRNLTVLLITAFCAGCALTPDQIQKAPLLPNQAIVFDIDGTLTPTPAAISIAREDAANAVRLYADKGYKIIYLSARIPLFQAGIPKWLKENDFPEGSIHVPTAEDSSNHAIFKVNILRQYKENGWVFKAAYGDSGTDFEAYNDNSVRIEEDNVFALLREGNTSCEMEDKENGRKGWKKCLASWTEHMGEIRASLKNE